MEDKDKSVPYLLFEAVQARHERTVKRLIVALIIVTAMIFVSNLAWMHEWMSYDYVSEEITVDSMSEGNANYIGNNGEINNGTNNSQAEDKN